METQLLETKPSLPVLLISDDFAAELPNLARLLGVRGFLHKPLGLMDFISAVHTLLDSPLERFGFPVDHSRIAP